MRAFKDIFEKNIYKYICIQCSSGYHKQYIYIIINSIVIDQQKKNVLFKRKHLS